MRRLFPTVLRTSDGVYTPPPPLGWMVILAVAVLAATTLSLVALHKPWAHHLMTGGAVTIAVLGHALYVRHRDGPRGRPSVACLNGAVVIHANLIGPEAFRIPTSEIRKLVVYGPAGRRIYRFLRHDGTHVEARPLWAGQPHKIEAEAIRFLQDALPGKVIVEAPQTAFATVRGDGPDYDA